MTDEGKPRARLWTVQAKVEKKSAKHEVEVLSKCKRIVDNNLFSIVFALPLSVPVPIASLSKVWFHNRPLFLLALDHVPGKKGHMIRGEVVVRESRHALEIFWIDVSKELDNL